MQDSLVQNKKSSLNYLLESIICQFHYLNSRQPAEIKIHVMIMGKSLNHIIRIFIALHEIIFQ